MLPVSEIQDAEVRAFADRARAFVAGQRWCQRVTDCALAFAVAGIVGVFRVDLVPAPNSGADSTLWVVVGDLPPAYLIFDPGDTWQDALRAYADEMDRWVTSVREDTSLDDVIPVNVAPTREHAALLESRLDFLRRELIDVDPDSLEGDA